MTSLLIFRRAYRDVAILLVWIALVAFAVALAVGQPRLLRETVDAGARQAVAAAGADADVVVSADVSTHVDSAVAPVAPGDIESLANAMPKRLPAGLRSVYGGSTLTVLGPATRLSSIDGAVPVNPQPIVLQMAMLTPQNSSALRLVQGSLPSPTAGRSTIDVVLSAADARASGLTVGSIARVPTIPVSSSVSGSDQFPIRVVGIVSDAAAATASPWGDTPNLWTPAVPSAASDPIRITVLVSQPSVATVAARYTDPLAMSVRIRLDSAKFTAAREESVGAELIALSGHSNRLAGSTNAQLGVVSSFGTALADFPAQERAAVAQASVVAAGVLGVVAVVLLLVSRMLVARREAELALERARGASLVAIAARAFVETLVAGVIGAAIGLAFVALTIPGPFVEPILLGTVAAVAVLAVPVQVVVVVSGSWTGRKVPANRADRVELDRRKRARRIAIELTILALAIAAFVSLATRGLLETQTSGIDLLLTSAPLLLAATITIVILRLYRWPLRLGIALGRRSTGAIGLLAAVRAQRSIAVLPLLGLTLSVGLAVGGGLLASTVSAGQEVASWQRVGADVRVDATVSPAETASVASAPGVTGATALRSVSGVQLRLTGGTDYATLIAVDSRFPDFVGKLPTGGASASGVSTLRNLFTAGAASDALPVVVDQDLSSQFGSKNIGMYIGVKFVPLRVVGVTDESPAGYLGAPFIYVDRSALATQLGQSMAANVMLVNGPGARAAVAGLDASASAIHSRAQWLSARAHLALVRGVSEAITLATLATALAAIIALVVILLSGARERGRSLALVRTLGLPARLGWWLALAEVAPLLVAALIGGVVAGVGIVVFLEPAMGLRELAGGLNNPQPTISPALIGGLVAAAIVLLLVAVLIEVAVRRRDRLSEVLRVGE
jgi:putative ABC transport system permease protein